MALDVYFRHDVKHGIVAVAVAMLSAAVAQESLNIEYCRGVLDTARAQALNFGLSWSGVLAELRDELADTRHRTLMDLLAGTIPAGPLSARTGP